MLRRLLVLLLLAGAPVLALAQSWYVTNNSNRSLTFQFHEPQSGWMNRTVHPHQPTTFPMWGTVGKFRIATQNRGYVEYEVRAGQHYVITWDAAKGMWDLRRSAGPGAPPPVAVAPGGSWVLHNRSNETLKFDTFDPARGSWITHTVFPNQGRTFTLSPGVRTGKIRVATQGRGFVQYDVHAGWRYGLVWDRGKQVWDLRTEARS